MSQGSDDPKDLRETSEPGEQTGRDDDGLGVRDGSGSGTKRYEEAEDAEEAEEEE